MEHKKIFEIAKASGFVLWGDEDYNVNNAVVDWSSEYDDSLIEFAQKIAEHCIQLAENVEKPAIVSQNTIHNMTQSKIIASIQREFNLPEKE